MNRQGMQLLGGPRDDSHCKMWESHLTVVSLQHQPVLGIPYVFSC